MHSNNFNEYKLTSVYLLVYCFISLILLLGISIAGMCVIEDIRQGKHNLLSTYSRVEIEKEIPRIMENLNGTERIQENSF